MINPEGVLGFSLSVTVAMMAISLLLVVYRILRGPSLPDRVIALDMLNVLIVGIVSVDAIGTNSPEFLPAALVLALPTFLATIAFANYLSMRARDE